MMELYGPRFSAATRSVRIAQQELHVKLRYVDTDDELAPGIGARGPMCGDLPALYIHEGLVLWDSNAIIDWLDATHGRSLTPRSLDAKAIARAWSGWASRVLYEPVTTLLQGPASAQVEATRVCEEILPWLEPSIPASDWLVGQFSIADIALAPALVSLPPEVLARVTSQTRAYVSRLQQRPSIAEACDLGTVEADDALLASLRDEVPPPDEALASILIVDDHPANLLALEAILAPLGQAVVRARSGDEALRYVLTHDPAVILMDVCMPGLDGLQTVALLRHRPRSLHVPVLFLTAHDDVSSKAYALGAIDFLRKPLDGDALRAKVNALVELNLYSAHRSREAAKLARVAAGRNDHGASQHASPRSV